MGKCLYVWLRLYVRMHVVKQVGLLFVPNWVASISSRRFLAQHPVYKYVKILTHTS